jgi:phage gpG-like protein
VSISPEENVAFWEGVRAKAMRGAKPAADAMARYLVERARNDTLARTTHPAGAWHHTKAGEPPARASGNLARHMFYKPASAGVRASAIVGNDAEYSRILEFGCVITPVNRKFMHWRDSGGSWYHKVLVVPPHPYVSTTTEEAMRDGGLHDAFVDAFEPYDP